MASSVTITGPCNCHCAAGWRSHRCFPVVSYQYLPNQRGQGPTVLLSFLQRVQASQLCTPESAACNKEGGLFALCSMKRGLRLNWCSTCSSVHRFTSTATFRTSAAASDYGFQASHILLKTKSMLYYFLVLSSSNGSVLNTRVLATVGTRPALRQSPRPAKCSVGS